MPNLNCPRLQGQPGFLLLASYCWTSFYSIYPRCLFPVGVVRLLWLSSNSVCTVFDFRTIKPSKTLNTEDSWLHLDWSWMSSSDINSINSYRSTRRPRADSNRNLPRHHKLWLLALSFWSGDIFKESMEDLFTSDLMRLEPGPPTLDGSCHWSSVNLISHQTSVWWSSVGKLLWKKSPPLSVYTNRISSFLSCKCLAVNDLITSM